MLVHRTFARFAPFLLVLAFSLAACMPGATTPLPNGGKGTATPAQPGHTLAELRLRPLLLHQLKAGAACQTSPARSVTTHFGSAQGEGPAYAIGTAEISHAAILQYADIIDFQLACFQGKAQAPVKGDQRGRRCCNGWHQAGWRAAMG